MKPSANSDVSVLSRWVGRPLDWFAKLIRRGTISSGTSTVFLAGTVGVLAGVGAAIFTWLIETITEGTLGKALSMSAESWTRIGTLMMLPAFGLLVVSWFTRRFAPEAQGHGVPEVITAVARNDGIIKPRVVLVKILASGFCIGTGGSVGREGLSSKSDLP